MRIIGIIPARWGSTRFEGKVLAEIAGRPMIQHVWERARQSCRLNEVIIAGDTPQICQAAQRFSAKAVLTSKDHRSGTDRIAEAVRSIEADIIVNIQGDEPLLSPKVIDQLVETMLADASCTMTTVINPIENKSELENPNVVKVVIDYEGYALYFSRSVIPYNRRKVGDGRMTYYKHVGLYAYTRDFLLRITRLPPSFLETMEQLEQLRVLEAGCKIKTCLTDYESIGVDTPEDLRRVEELMSKREAESKMLNSKLRNV